VKEGVALEFYSPSEKIKLMRKKFRINQADLESVNMTRAFISMMESGKRNVSKASSGKLVSKFKELAMKISVTLDIDDEYFSRQPKDDARYYIEENLKINNSNKELEELITIATDFNIDDLLAKIYESYGEKLLAEKDYLNAFMKFRLALGKYQEIGDFNKQALLYKQLGVCQERRGEYGESEYYFKQAINNSLERNNFDLYYKLKLNMAIVYAKSKQYTKCIELLDESILNSEAKVDNILLINAKLTKANALMELSDSRALKEYLDLVDEIGDTNDFILSALYNNIAEFYYNTGDFNNSLKYVNKAQALKIKVNKMALPSSLSVKGKVFFKLGLFEESTMLFNLAIDIAEEYKVFDMLFASYKDLAEAYESRKELEKVSYTLNRYIQTIDYYNVEYGKGYAICKLAQVSAMEENSEVCIDMLSKLEAYVL
jgi:tetratricopeptide (TPR) repeat protein